MSFVVCVPAYNRAKTLPQALDSLIAQTYPNWTCLIFDDGSTDNTREVVRGYLDRDKRFKYGRSEHNMGGVRANHELMRQAPLWGKYWSRLGSDDYWHPWKLDLDRITLDSGIDACYGCYQVKHESFIEETLYSAPAPARSTLLSMGFYASWANCAVRTDILYKVRSLYGTFCDGRIRNLEDWMVNTRVASFTDWVWRGLTKDKTLVIGPRSWEETGYKQSDFVADAWWRVAQDGASAKPDVIAEDARLTREAIEADFRDHPPLPDAPRFERTVIPYP